MLWYELLMKKKAVFMNSGGPDALAAALITYKDYQLYSLYIDVGIPNRKRAMPVAERIADKYCGSRHYVMTLQGEWGVPSEGYFNNYTTNPKPSRTIRINVPYQGVVFNSLAMVYAIHVQTDIIISGSRNDMSVQKQTDLLNQASKECALGRYIDFRHVIHDISDKEIHDIVITDEELKDYTVSCDQEEACFNCYKCDRKTEKLKLKEDNYVGKIKKGNQ